MAITIQVDASQKGLGATLLKDDHPVTLATKALMSVKQDYVNIECEMLACAFGMEWVHTCFGHTFTAQSDHKPLKQIEVKNLTDVPVCLQRKLLSLQNYDVTIKYNLGKKMLVVDNLCYYAPPDALI